MNDSASAPAPAPVPEDKARAALEEIRERNEAYIVRAKLTEWTVSHERCGDVRLLLCVLGELLDAHPWSVAADGEAHCVRCAWDTGARTPLDKCLIRQVIMSGLGQEAVSAGFAPGCGCPARGGKVYHQRGTCTDPFVAQLGWYADDPA